MKINLKTKRKDKDSPPIVVFLIITIALLGAPIFIIYKFIEIADYNLFKIVEALPYYSHIGFIIFLLLSSGIYISVYSFIKLFTRPKPYKAKLLHQKREKYKDKEITIYKIKLLKKDPKLRHSIQEVYTCYTEEQQPLEVNKEYQVNIKEFNWQIISIEPLMLNDNDINFIPTVSFKPTLLLVLSSTTIMTTILVFATIYSIINNQKVIGIIIPLVLYISVTYALVKSLFFSKKK